MTLGKLRCTTIEDDASNSITVATLTTLDSGKAPKASPTFTGTVTMPATVALAGQASDITIPDNQAAALEVKEGTNAYVTFNSTNSGEQIEVDKAVVASENITLENEKALRLSESGSGSNFIGLKAPNDLSGADTTYTLPAAPGSANLVLSSTTGGVMSWVANPDTDTVFSVDAEHTWTKGQRGEITTVTSGSTITIDFDASNNFQVALGHNVTTVAISNATVGQSGSIFFAQPTSGSTTHTVGGWNSAFKFPAATAPTLSTAINKVDRVDYIIRATDQIHVVATLDMAV